MQRRTRKALAHLPDRRSAKEGLAAQPGAFGAQAIAIFNAVKAKFAGFVDIP